MLPKKIVLDKMMEEAKRGRITEVSEAEKLRRGKAFLDAERKLNEEANKKVEYVEKCILENIKQGNNSKAFRFGNGHTPDLVWERAISILRQDNKDYIFELKSINVECNNFYADTTDPQYVFQEWNAPMWQLMATW